MEIRFLGAADTVTGSRHLVRLGDRTLLLDCGMFQGFKVLRERNWAPLAVEPRSIDAVLLSHAHLDHSGWLPVLVRSGFRGPIYATQATRDLAEVLLLDAAHLEEEDARRANRLRFSRHARALPLYTRADAQRAMARFVPVATGRPLTLGAVQAIFTPVGHLLGACSIHLAGRGERLTYSGDVGRADDLLMPAPQPAPAAETVLVESTYGDRSHPRDDAAQRLAAIVRETAARGGSVLLPAFAVGRTQALLLLLQRLRRAGEIPKELPLVVDSPMAVQATALYRRHARLLRNPAREIAGLVDDVRLVTTLAQSQRVVAARWPAVIISASGMATGGRVLGHLKAMAPDPRHHIVFAGFQVGGSRGAKLVGGATTVKIHGTYVPVRARVSALDGLSAHADADGLLDWLRRMPEPPKQVFVVHGEPQAADTLRLRVKDTLGCAARVPQHGETVQV